MVSLIIVLRNKGYCLKLLSKGTSGVLSQEQFLFGASALRILIMIISLASWFQFQVKRILKCILISKSYHISFSLELSFLFFSSSLLPLLSFPFPFMVLVCVFPFAFMFVGAASIMAEASAYFRFSDRNSVHHWCIPTAGNWQIWWEGYGGFKVC